MNRIHTIHVIPTLPKKLERLRSVALDLHWVWSPDAIDLFRRLDQDLWVHTEQNPVRMLAEIGQERLENIASDEGFLAQLDRIWHTFESYRKESTWYQKTFTNHKKLKIAYFSAEFGLHESLPVYSGGLGVLAGDYLKAASDLGIPIIGVGLAYQKGYFRQYLNADGWQQESYPENDMFCLPIELLRDEASGKPIECNVWVGSRDVALHIWRVQIGRTELYLLDTNVLANDPEDRKITETLYGGGYETRIRQEIVLGIGGLIALEKLGIDATIFHLNEGHSAFMALERIRKLMEESQLTFEEARLAAKSSNVFTTHTPVPAGIDRFGKDLIDKYFQSYWPQLGLDRRSFFALGGADPDKTDTTFNMAILAIKLSATTNGVSQLHASVSRNMWKDLWPGVHKSEIPILGITNGVHAPSWISDDMRRLLDRELGPRWEENPLGTQMWKRVQQISNEEIYRMRERLRRRLIAFSRKRLRKQLSQRNANPSEIEQVGNVLDMETLTIGFARRFATYKRAGLLFSDRERLLRILTNPQKPVQLIFAGKAHPADEPGKRIIREIVHFARDERVRNRIVFIEDYDINVARHMVQGCDVWLNNPRRPLEASGTSGMKAAVNGVLNCSTLDGWWDEAFSPKIGWAIGHGETYDDVKLQDKVESEALYDILEEHIVPLFYHQDSLGVPRAWTNMIKDTLEIVFPRFVMARMVDEYTQQAYLPCLERYERLSEDGFKRTRELNSWTHKIQNNWSAVKVLDVVDNSPAQLHVGESINVTTTVSLGQLEPSDVCVEAFRGPLSGDRELQKGDGIALSFIERDERGNCIYGGDLLCDSSGYFGYAIRILPCHEDVLRSMEMGYVVWES
ncbi:alpha-glucan family phosphorylase [bacterium]|nr:alpha-glucan family phosphorylase [bacterium]